MEKPEWREADERIIGTVIRRVRPAGCCSRDDLVELCKWKWPPKDPARVECDEDFITETTKLAFRPETGDRLRVACLTLLRGVKRRTATAILHFYFLHDDPEECYPVLDVHALKALGVNDGKAKKYDDYEFWRQYTDKCRQLSRESHLNMRELDRALWYWGKHCSNLRAP
jgi:hypothetical protein